VSLRLDFKILCYLFYKKGNAKKLYKGSKEFWKVFLGSFFYRNKEQAFLNSLADFTYSVAYFDIQNGQVTVSPVRCRGAAAMMQWLSLR
jgi:hypothetical protein